MPAKKEESSEVATQSYSMPAELMDEVADSGVLGYSERSEDNLIPILSILQDNSGEVKKNHSRQIQGAEPGMMIIRSLGRIIDDQEGLLFQPCGFQHAWVEWEGDVGDGVVVAQYPFDQRPSEAKLVRNEESDRDEWVMPNNNRLVETRYHIGHMIEEDTVTPLVIPMGGTNHTVSRQWTSLMGQFRMPNRKSAKAPGFLRKYHLKTSFNQRGSQSWYKYGVTDLGWIEDQDLIRQGLELAKMTEKDEITVDTSEGEKSDSTEEDSAPI